MFSFQTQFRSVKKTQMSRHFNICLRPSKSLWSSLLEIPKEFMRNETQDVIFFFQANISGMIFLGGQVLSVRSSRQKGFIISKKLLLKPISVTAFGILLTWRKPSFSFQENILQKESSSGIRGFECILFDGKVHVKFVSGKKYLNFKT